MPRALVPLASRWTVLLLFCTCPPVVIPGLAQISTQPLSSNPETRYKLGGTVINSVSGEPIRRALVQIHSNPARQALTDGNGQFQFEGLAPGETRISARKQAGLLRCAAPGLLHGVYGENRPGNAAGRPQSDS